MASSGCAIQLVDFIITNFPSLPQYTFTLRQFPPSVSGLLCTLRGDEINKRKGLCSCCGCVCVGFKWKNVNKTQGHACTGWEWVGFKDSHAVSFPAKVCKGWRHHSQRAKHTHKHPPTHHSQSQQASRPSLWRSTSSSQSQGSFL